MAHTAMIIYVIFTDGQAVAHRLSKQLNRTSASIRKHVTLYNNCRIYGETTLPINITFDEAVATPSEIYISIENSVQV